jgi:hypothetical protein
MEYYSFMFDAVLDSIKWVIHFDILQYYSQQQHYSGNTSYDAIDSHHLHRASFHR